MTAAPAQQPNPLPLFENVTAYQRSEAIKAAVELDIFTAIGQGHDTPAKLAAQRGVAARGARILCDFLTVHNLLTKHGERYALTPDTAMFLDRRSLAYMGGTLQFLLTPGLTDHFRDLAVAVRKGGTAATTEGTISPENPVWVEFARAMAPMMAFPAEGIAELLRAHEGGGCKVLDIAAGHGLFGIAIARRNPQARVVAVDWRNVLEVAKENAQQAGVGQRYRTMPGSAFDVDFGADYDIALLTNFLHHFDVPTCEKLLRKVHAALAPGGRVATLEFVPNDDRVSPPAQATFALAMLATTPAGDAYTFAELERMFRNAGFARSEMHALPPSFQHVVISTK
ncbi:MAG: methyltransferase [Candidatus Acidiferrales bacterium]